MTGIFDPTKLSLIVEQAGYNRTARVNGGDMHIGKRALIALFGLALLTSMPAAADSPTEFESRIFDPEQGDKAHHDLCDSNSPSFRNNEALMREMGLKRFPGAAFNRLSRGMIADTIDNGIIVAMEKAPRKQTDVGSGFHSRYLKSFAEAYPAGGTEVAPRDRFLQSTFSHPKPIHVSHIYEYSDRKACALYSAYTESRMCAGRQATAHHDFTSGMEALQAVFETRVTPALNSGRYSHVLFMAMGWHNDQQVSICRYDAISTAVRTASDAIGQPFEPYIVGVTWPSAWFSSNPVELVDKVGHIGSVFNKADDADEIGYLVGNMIANRLIPRANRKKLPFVALGHSFGTRVINRSVFSRDLLRDGAIGSGPDLTIALQPAHSIFRFLPGRGVEGHPFADIDNLDTIVVATSSKRDTANPLAIWSRYVGGRTGLAIARNDKNRDWVDFVARNDSLGPHKAVSHALDQLDARPGTPTIVDATGFVFEHNDVMSEDMGRFVAGLIARYAQAR